MQKTILHSVDFEGVGLHSGQQITMRVLPAPEDFGIRFYRQDVPEAQREIFASFDRVSDTRLNTRITNEFGVSVSTIEHLMAAFAGMGITNARVELNASEVPVLDGSSKLYVERFWQAGLEEQVKAATVYKVTKPVRVEGLNGAYAQLSPSEHFTLDVSIDFADQAIGKQSLRLDLANGVFVRELSDSRTFTRYQDVQMLQENGLALGGSLQNAVVVDQGEVLNPEGFRHENECVRHKMLDALGDLYLAGGAILGAYKGHLSGHALTNQLLRKAFETGALQDMSAQKAVQVEPYLPGFALVPSDFVAA